MRNPSGITYIGHAPAVIEAGGAGITLADVITINRFVETALRTRTGRGLVTPLGGQAFHITGRPTEQNPGRAPRPDEMLFWNRVVRPAGRATPLFWSLTYSLNFQSFNGGLGKPNIVDWYWTVDGFSGSVEGLQADALLMRVCG